MSDYTTNFPPQTYSSSFYLNSLVDDEKGALVTKSEISSGSEARNGPLLDCFISTMKYLLHPVPQLLCLSTLFHFSAIVSSLTKECVLNYDTKPVTFSSLVKFQASHCSFDPKHRTYLGNIVNFSFDTIDRLLKNSFVSFDSDNIIKMTLSEKRIERIDAGAFNGLFCLHYLELNRNIISNLTEDVFEGLGNLQHLDLSENLFLDISGLLFHRLSNLSKLNLSKNRIHTINTLAFFNLTRLEILDLSFNNLKSFTAAVFSPLQKLRELYLNNNYLGDIEPETWTGLNNLEVLNLAKNHLNKFDTSYNFSFESLKRLNLSGNYLTSLNSFNLRKSLPKLEAIDITENNWLCEDLEVLNHQLADTRIAQIGNAKCNLPGEYNLSTTEKYAITSTPVVQTEVANKSKVYLNDTLVQEEILATSEEVVGNIQRNQAIFVVLFVVLITYILIDIAAKYGICQFLRLWMTGRNFRWNRGEPDHMLLRTSDY